MNKLRIAPLFWAAVMLTGCGGGGGGGGSTNLSYSGAADPVAITSTNAQPFAQTSVEASSQMISQYQSSAANPFGVEISSASLSPMKSKITEIAKIILKNNQADQFPVGAVVTSDELNTYSVGMFCGGSVTVPDSTTGTFTYNNLCITDFDGKGNNAYMNGSMQYSVGDGFFKTTYTNLTVTLNNTVISSMNGSDSCTWDPGTNYTNYHCTTTSFYKGGDGKTYQVADEVVTGDDTSGWNVHATFYHPDYGSVSIVATGIKFACDNGHPSAGTIVITGSDSVSSVTVSFQDCNTYTGSYTTDGGSTTVSFTGW